MAVTAAISQAIEDQQEYDLDIIKSPQRNWTERHSALMSLCRQTDITLQTGSKSVIQSRDHLHYVKSTEANCVPESSQQRPCFYNAEWNSFPGLKEGQRDRITVVTAVTCSLAGRQNGPPPHSYG
ncbi:hypothetical protein CRENBAI_022905, partial [Crenichthys baileyi]